MKICTQVLLLLQKIFMILSNFGIVHHYPLVEGAE